MKQVAVIIVNWKVKDLLRACLVSVQAHSGIADDYEVIVVDNDSGDGSVEMVRAQFPAVRLVANTDNVGFGAANNQVLPITAAPYLVLLNPDTVVLDGALGKMVDRLKQEKTLGIVGCKLLNGDGSLQRWTGGAFPNLANVFCHYFFLNKLLPEQLLPSPLYLERDETTPLDVGWVSGACMAIRREALKDKLFDDRFFMYAEDMELCYRLGNNGWRISYDPRMQITHYQGASIQQQKTGIMLSSLKGPRYFFLLTHGPVKAKILDLITVGGFGLRAALYQIAAWVRPKSGFNAKARSSRTYLGIAWKVMAGSGKKPEMKATSL